MAVKFGINENRKPVVEWAVLPDVLFLIGCIAHDEVIADQLCGMEAVESILSLLKISLKCLISQSSIKKKLKSSASGISVPENPETNLFISSTRTISKTLQHVIAKKRTKPDDSLAISLKKSQMNGCLALATLNIKNNSSVVRFGNSGGLDLNIELMNNALGNSLNHASIDDFDYDIANAAAALICNSSYRRPDIQQLYGQKGACIAVMRVRSNNFSCERFFLNALT